MRRLGKLLLCLISLSLLSATMVHAREETNTPTIECSGFVHSDGDADQSQGDADKAMPHHHGSCHSAPAFVPVASTDEVHALTRSAPSFIPAATVSKRWAIGPDLRPPIA
jgi:hypothetical protein